MQDLRHVESSLRFAGVFAVLMLLPTGFLAYQALTTVRSEELSLDADLRARARGVATSIYADVEEIFGRFEQVALARLDAGGSPSVNPRELSPYLRAAFKFDGSGKLVAPFALPRRAPLAQPSPAWRRDARAAQQLELREPFRAAGAWRAVERESVRPGLRAEAVLGQVRAHMAARRFGAAKQAATRLAEEFPGVRGRHGFLMSTVGAFKVNEIAMRLAQRRGRGSDEARDAMEDLVVDLLSVRQWEIGQPGEAALAREAIRLLSGRSEREWLAARRSQLNRQVEQLQWAARVLHELDGVYYRVPAERQFRYLGANAGSAAVWALVRVSEDVFAFSFSIDDLRDELDTAVRRRSEAEPDLTARLRVIGEPPEGAFAVRSLGPWLPLVSLVVQPSDLEALRVSNNRRRTVRVGVVLTAVFVLVVGAYLVARMIALEVDGARQRADFAANVSHELRSPITQIRLKGEALQLGLAQPGPDMQEHFDAIVRESERLSRLVDNVLDFAAIERGAKRYHLRPDDPVPVVVAAVESARSSFEALGVAVVMELPEDLPPLWIDREALGQVLTNLLSNAAKYGAEGRYVRVAVEPREDGVEICVQDRGRGIGPDEQESVFDDFFRSSDPMVRRQKGTGIGLAIVRYIVEAHGGTIRVESAPGRGASFIITLPFEPPDGAGEPA